MRVVAALAVAVLAVFAGRVGSASAATHECDGFQICIAVTGPWVIVPTGGATSRPQVSYVVTCPRRYVVGGLDAELSQRGIDVEFSGAIGSPITPGVTTSNSVVVTARYVGRAPRAPTFRPHVGCIPASGAGGRIPTALTVVRVGHPTMWRVRTVRVRPGATRVAAMCRARESVVAASHALGFVRSTPPEAGLVGSLSATQEAVVGRRVTITVHADAELGGSRAVAQVGALCAVGG